MGVGGAEVEKEVRGWGGGSAQYLRHPLVRHVHDVAVGKGLQVEGLGVSAETTPSHFWHRVTRTSTRRPSALVKHSITGVPAFDCVHLHLFSGSMFTMGPPLATTLVGGKTSSLAGGVYRSIGSTPFSLGNDGPLGPSRPSSWRPLSTSMKSCVWLPAGRGPKSVMSPPFRPFHFKANPKTGRNSFCLHLDPL